MLEGGETMEKVKELLMQQMELLQERAKRTEDVNELAVLTGSMRSLSAEMRDIKCEAGTRVRLATAQIEAKGANGEPLTLLK